MHFTAKFLGLSVACSNTEIGHFCFNLSEPLSIHVDLGHDQTVTISKMAIVFQNGKPKYSVRSQPAVSV